MIKVLIVSVLLLLTHNTLANKPEYYAAKSVTYKTEGGVTECQYSTTHKAHTSKHWGTCIGDDTVVYLDAPIVNDGVARKWYYDIRPKVNRDCGVKYNPKTGKSHYVYCGYGDVKTKGYLGGVW